VQFEHNGQSFLLSFNAHAGRWYLLTPGIDGEVQAIPVRNEEEIGAAFKFAVPAGSEDLSVIN
jgi:hypothetical protein